MTDLPRLYTDLAPWFPILTAPEDYAHEASRYQVGFSPSSVHLDIGITGKLTKGSWR